MSQRMMAHESEAAARERAPGPVVGEYHAPRAATARRIVYLWDADYPWDVRTEKICATLTSAGHDVHIVARNRARRPLIERMPEGTVHRMRPWLWAGRRFDVALGFPAFFNPRWRSTLRRVLRSVRPDVLIARDLPLAPAAIGVARRYGVPVVLDMAENYPAMMQMIFDAARHRPTDYLVRNPRAVAAVERHALSRVERVLVVIEEMEQRLRTLGVGAERIDIVSNTPPVARAGGAAAPRARGGGQPLAVVYLGLLEVARGIMELVHAAALLRDRAVPVRFLIIGAGRDRELFTTRAAELGLGESVLSFPGFVPRERALELVAGADVGVLPHHANDMWNTTIPNKLFDYMAAGLPVVTSSAVPCARIVRETEAGMVFASGNVTELADAVQRMMDPAVRERCGTNGRRAVRDEYNWERDTRVLLRSVERAAAARTRAGAG
ncbi:MAG TPA: glycosyltransferase family 4 protein [Gemmatimonadaceae bacterium]|nr:glycosyltransferase family 4 protein [Gemmatimonadaceae bacterium]